MASLPILRYSLLILVLFSSILLLGSAFLDFYLFSFFFSVPWHFFRDGGMAGATGRARHGH